VVDTPAIVTPLAAMGAELAENASLVVVYGDAGHPRGDGRSELGRQASLRLTEDTLDSLPEKLSSRVAVISQTTQRPGRFAASSLGSWNAGLTISMNCGSFNTSLRRDGHQQTAAQELAQKWT